MFESWHSFPLVRILLPFAAGILIADQSGWSCQIPFLILVLLLLTLWSATALSIRQSNAYGMAWLLWVGLAGTTFLSLHQPHAAMDHWVHTGMADREETPDWAGQVRDLTLSGQWIRINMDVDSVIVANRPVPVSGRLLVYLDAEQNREVAIGQTIRFTGRPAPVMPPSDPYGFDWRRYQFVRGVTHQVFVRGQADAADDAFSWRTALGETRQQIQGSLTRLVRDTTAHQLLAALMLGARDELGDEVNQAYQSSGAVHILAVSGLHVGLVAGFSLLLFGFLWPGRRNSWQVALPTVLLVWTYIALTGAADSALRAGVLFSFLLLGRALSRHAEALNLLAGAALLLLLINPWMIFHVGFQLSVMAVAGIVVLHPLIFRSWTPPDRISRFFWNLAAITLAAQAATLMLSLYYFHQFPTYFLLSGLFVVPLSGLLLGSGWLTIFLDLFHSELAAWVAWIPELTARVMNALVFGIAHLPGALSFGWAPAIWWTCLVPLAVGALLYAIRMKQSRAFLVAGVALILGLALDVADRVQQRRQVEWGVIRRMGHAPEAFVRQGSDGLLIDLSGERSELERVTLPGYGRVWLVPRWLDLKFGGFEKDDAVLTFGEESLSWGDRSVARTHLAIGRPSGEKGVQKTETLLLPWNMPPWEKQAWRDLDPGELVDLREHGAWIRSFR